MLSRAHSYGLAADMSLDSIGFARLPSCSLLHGFNGSRLPSLSLSRLPSLELPTELAPCSAVQQVHTLATTGSSV
jgi:hypothetical protein